MATQAKSKAESKELSSVASYKEQLAAMMAALSPEERAAMMAATGQSEVSSGNRVPVLKVNYQARPDSNKKKVPTGNWVVGQKQGKDSAGEAVLEEAGTDLGEEIEVVLLAFVRQYSYWNKDPKKCCSSQLLLSNKEKPYGNNLKHCCSDGTCPRRADGIDSKEKCSGQHVVYVKLPDGTTLPDGTPCPVAMMYVKGSSYMPFQDYTKAVTDDGIPMVMITTKIGNIEGYHGAVVYYTMEFNRGNLVSVEDMHSNTDAAKGIMANITDYKAEQEQKREEKPQRQISSASSGEVVSGTAGDSAMPIEAGDDDMDWGD